MDFSRTPKLLTVIFVGDLKPWLNQTTNTATIGSKGTKALRSYLYATSNTFEPVLKVEQYYFSIH